MTQDIFLRLDGIQGESQDVAHKDDIEVIGWHWCVTQSSDMHRGSGGGAGKATVGELSLEHYMDRASPNLMKYSLTGKHIPGAVLCIRKAGDAPLEYLKFELGDVLITSVSPIYYQTMARPREHVTLSFARFSYEYVIQGANGGPAGAVRMAFDIKKNLEV